MADRSLAPRSVPGRTDERRVAVIAQLRGLRMTGAQIAECLGMALFHGVGRADEDRVGKAQSP